MNSLQKLISVYRSWAANSLVTPDVPVVQVDNIASKVAAFYEKLRSVVGWTEEHLLRKSAIARILRRAIFLKDRELADALVRDLVRGGYFPNNTIPEAKISKLEIALKKYLFLIEYAQKYFPLEQRRLKDWLLEIAASEVEAFLDPPLKEEALLEFMTEQMNKRISVEQPISDKDKENLIFITVRQALFKLDEPIITYELIRKYIPHWTELNLEVSKDKVALESFASDLWRWYDSITRTFNHSSIEKFYWASEILDTPYLILGDMLSDLAKSSKLDSENLPEGSDLEILALDKYDSRLALQKKKALRAAIYSTISIFISKILIALFIEVPVDKLTEQFSIITLVFNIVIPALLMIIIVSFGLKAPSESNAEKVVSELRKILSGAPSPYLIKLPTRRSFIMSSFVGLLYFLGTAVTFSFTVYMLTRLNFSILSQAIFIFFVSLIAFAGLRIRERSKELIIEERTPGFIHDLFLFFTFPIIELGRWFSKQLFRIRLVAVVLDVFIELPLHSFVEFIEQWRAFLKEKKRGIH